jgi:hypothetical protein
MGPRVPWGAGVVERAGVVGAVRVRLVRVGISKGLFGKPVPGRSLHWLDDVVRVLAEREAEDGGKEHWEEWDPSWSDTPCCICVAQRPRDSR